ncbi:MAG: hypothetical protein ACREM8_13375, partial [Vulcanimicrobiaceae bacterium]
MLGQLQFALLAVAPLTFIVVGAGIGLVVDFVVLGRLRRGLDLHHRLMLARVVAAFRGAPTVWLTALGLWSTLAAYP